MNYYLVVFNNFEGFDSNEIHKTITGITTVTDWWHYLPNVYIVSTESGSEYIANKIIASFKGLSFLVIKIDIGDYNGVLTKDAWEWINKKKNQNVTLKPIGQSPNLSALQSALGQLLSGSLPKPPTQATAIDLAKLLEEYAKRSQKG